MTDSSLPFAKFVPGVDFLQSLIKGAGSALPGMGQWIAPTLNPEELEKRISELRTVQFWLEQNARMLGATIQALEVQRMTLSTLQSMNVPVAELGRVLQARMPQAAQPAPVAPPPAPPPAPSPTPAPLPPAVEAPAGPAAVDPMQWWGALTQQFSELAASALKDGPVDAMKGLAGVVTGARPPADAAPAAATRKSAAAPVAAKERAGAAAAKTRRAPAARKRAS